MDRIVGILLVACLIADPALAAESAQPSLGSCGRDGSCLAVQALAPPVTGSRKMLLRERPLGALFLALAVAMIGGAAVYGWIRLRTSPPRMTRLSARAELLEMKRWFDMEGTLLEETLRRFRILRPEMPEQESQATDAYLNALSDLRALIEELRIGFRRSRFFYSPFVTRQFEEEIKMLDVVRKILLEMWNDPWLEVAQRTILEAWRESTALEEMLGLSEKPESALPPGAGTRSA